MKKKLPRALLLFIVLAAAGCASTSPSFQAPEPRPLGRDLPSATAEPGTPAATAEPFVEPTGTLTLRDALVAALTNSPELASCSWEVRALEAEALQAGTRPNPEFAAEIENFGGGGDLRGFRGAETTLALSQIIELGGKRAKRMKVAEQEQGLAAWDYETRRIEVMTSTTRDFIAVLESQELLGLAQDLVEIAEDFLASVSRRVKAGSTSPIQENRARVELETSRIERDRAERALAAARRQLAANWGGTAPSFTRAQGDIEEIPAPPPLEALWDRVEQNPSLARWTVEMDHRRAALELEESLRSLDLSVGAGVRYFNESDDAAFVLALGLPVPVFDRNEGASRAAALRLNRAGEDRRAAAVRIRTMIGMSHEDLLATGAEIEALRDRALPEAEAAFAAANETYLRGSMRFIDVLDIERMLFSLKSRYIAALARYHVTVADLEGLTGESIGTSGRNTGSN